VNTSRRVLLGYRVGYERVPRLGVIEALHALDPANGRAMCGRPVAISWSAEEAADTMIDCRDCLSAVEQPERRG
jgi:hypothetical protein